HMNIQNSSSILIDSGGGWFNTKKAAAILFNKPQFSLSFSNDKIKIFSAKNDSIYFGDPISHIEEYVSKGYYGVGYIGYDYLEKTNSKFKSSATKEGTESPQLFFHFYKPEDLTRIKYSDINSSARRKPRLVQIGYSKPVSNITKPEYLKKVERIKRYIADGDIYQVNLSQRFSSRPLSDPLSYFFSLYNTQPVPYSAYINFGEFQLISGSMELFLQKIGNKIITKPIKGTAKRGANQFEDRKLKIGLKSSSKERAENLMIVDLMRNDLGRICEYGSIKVKELFKIKSFKTLFQMESQIEGTLKNSISLTDIIYNTFPPGSVTGAPKVRAIEIIDELEPHYRGPYCGAVCFLKPYGDFTISVAIRVKLNTRVKSIFWVGGGIVWDSDPETEYEETILKSKAITEADLSLDC
ncbi:MAG: aminodeoxychorismate synthase component I, partial [Thermodesulfobacteriota bacterium]